MKDNQKTINNSALQLPWEMPCHPRDINIFHWALPQTFGKTEQEEIAARLLDILQKEGNDWRGVTWKELAGHMLADAELLQQQSVIHEENRKEELRYTSEMRKYVSLSVLTLGIYMLTYKKPRKNLQGASEAPFSMLLMGEQGYDMLTNAIHTLIEKGMLVKKDINEKDVAFLPTKAFAQVIMQKQGLKAI